MNKWIGKGNLVRDVELQTTTSGISLAKFTIAVQRKFANADGEREADFINCVAWRNTAEFVAKYFKKGSQIIVCGAVQTRSYETEDGAKRYVTEIVCEEIYFCGNKVNSEEQIESKQEEFIPIDDLENLPF